MFLIALKIVLDSPPKARTIFAYQEQFLGLHTKQKDNFLNNETNSFLGTLSVRDHVFSARKK